MKAPRKDAEDERLMTLMFRVALNGNLVRSAPAASRRHLKASRITTKTW